MHKNSLIPISCYPWTINKIDKYSFHYPVNHTYNFWEELNDFRRTVILFALSLTKQFHFNFFEHKTIYTALMDYHKCLTLSTC